MLYKLMQSTSMVPFMTHLSACCAPSTQSLADAQSCVCSAGRPNPGTGGDIEAGGGGQCSEGGSQSGAEAPNCQQPEEPGHPAGLPSPAPDHCAPAHRSFATLQQACYVHVCRPMSIVLHCYSSVAFQYSPNLCNVGHDCTFPLS